MDLTSLLRGAVAGYGIAIPIGPIGVLIFERGIRRGFAPAFCAGAGAATADLIYATAASLAGSLLIALLKPYAPYVRAFSAVGLIVFGIWSLHRGFSARRDYFTKVESGCLSTYAAFLGLTLLNPLTVAYFTTLILGLGASVSSSSVDIGLFVTGAFSASLSWQTFLAALGGLAHLRISSRTQTATFAVGNCIVVLLGILILFGYVI